MDDVRASGDLGLEARQAKLGKYLTTMQQQ